MLKRYALPDMAALWTTERKYREWLAVEIAVLQGRNAMGELQCAAVEAIAAAAKTNPERIAEFEKRFEHDMIAFVEDVMASLREAGLPESVVSEFHKRMTSYDIEDPAFIRLLIEATSLTIMALKRLRDALHEKASEHKWTIMIARTHGQFAEPDTFGRLLLVFESAIKRSLYRLEHACENELADGKISGAVGVYSNLNPKIEVVALQDLGLIPADAETQILQRDRHAALMAALAITAASMEQICRTFWEMMRGEVRELEEPRKKEQRGSSAMAHKKNPILTERLMGLARVLRGYLTVAVENIATPECRDISQSAPERIIFPDAFALVHYGASKLADMVEQLVVFPENMQQNLELVSRGVWASQAVRTALMEAGVPYATAYEALQRASFGAVSQERHLREVLEQFPIEQSRGMIRTVSDIIGEEKLRRCFNAEAQIEAGVKHAFAKFNK